MAVFITIWNPKQWTFPPGELEQAIQTTAAGGVWLDPWSLGSRRRGIEPGDIAVMVHQHHQRGLVASGRFASGVDMRRHWGDPSKLVPYADIEWDTWLPLDDRLPVETLIAEIHSVPWDQLRGSGVQVHEPDATKLMNLWDDHMASVNGARAQSAEEIGTYGEGATRSVVVNRYERDPRARRTCIERWGTSCSVCSFDFGATYGSIGDGFINVHHVKDLSLLGPNYEVDPEHDLRPVCPNCHAMLHTQRPALSINALKKVLRDQRAASTPTP